MTIQYLFNDSFVSPYGGDYTIRIVDAPTYISFTSTIDGFTATKLLKGDSNPNAEYYKITIPAYSTYRKVQVYGYSFRTNSDDKVLLLDLYQGGLDNFKTVKSGAYDDLNTWYIKDNSSSSVWQPAPYTPNRFNNIFIESTHTLTLNKEESCLNLNYINAENKTSVNTGAYNLNIYGILRRYTGTAPGSDAVAGGGIGTAQWLIGTYVLKGKTRNLPSVGYPSSFNLYGSKFIVDLDANQTVTILDLVGSVAYTLGGTFIVKSGSTFSTGNAQFRVAQTAATLAVADGDVIVESGGKMMTERLSPGGVVIGRGAANGFKSFNLNSGAIFESKSPAATVRIVAGTHNMNGAVYYSLAGAQNFLLGSASTPPGATSITQYSEVYLTNTGVKTLVNNTTINNKLSINGTASLALSTFTLSYGATGDLEILASKTIGVELPVTTSESAMPRNLIIPTGVTYNLGGATVNIRGTLQGGGSVTNGTLVQNYFSTVDFRSNTSGLYTAPNTWQMFVNSSWVNSLYTYPSSGNNIYIQGGHSVTLNAANLSCKDINLNTALNNITRINNNNYVLDFYGKLRFYSGTTPPGTSDAVNDGGLGWLANGILRAKGTSRTLLVSGEVAANANNINVVFDHALDTGQTGTMSANTVRFGYMTVSSGTFLMSQASSTIRLSGNGATLDPANMQGTFTVKSGATCKGGVALHRAPTSAMNTVTIEQGGVLWITSNNYIIGALNINLLGEVIMDIAGAANMINNTSRQYGSPIDTYYSLTLQNTGNYSLQFNTTVNTKLKMLDTSALTLNSKTLSYGINADLEIGSSRTKGSELPTGGSGAAIPRNLILGAGVAYDLGGATVNIRGTLSLGAGASITNGTLNQNQL